MSQPASSMSENAPRPLTSLTDEESLFRQSVREFADQQVRPLTSEMDEKGKFAPELIQQFFDLGLMG
ncbi:MAG TPA: acyl-CoA dehydrogenase family protein, partial [Blastocatellia bacterium]|nr:acyl-CoA dehydrogenase family protein [Blastocatellia bacterium]